ncbi:MAG: hypothetical protein JSU07_10500 [Bacteroidetes bacterium]|nr:hypothetical protein [Bacteroidota bacterium]
MNKRKNIFRFLVLLPLLFSFAAGLAIGGQNLFQKQTSVKVYTKGKTQIMRNFIISLEKEKSLKKDLTTTDCEVPFLSNLNFTYLSFHSAARLITSIPKKQTDIHLAVCCFKI